MIANILPCNKRAAVPSFVLVESPCEKELLPVPEVMP
jgi:hypothetical protein